MREKRFVMQDLGRVLRRRIAIQHWTLTGYDSYEQPIMEYVTLGHLWAKIEPLSGRQYLAAQQVQSEMTHKIITYYHPGWYTESGAWVSPWQLVQEGARQPITVTSRILFGERVFDILSIANWEERNEWLEFRCREQING
jgi:head-tail adaptor